MQSCVRRRQAKNQLQTLKTEARSVVHFKEVSYKLENKVVELTQTLQKRTADNKDLQSKLKGLESQLASWVAKHDEADGKARSLQAEVDKPTVALTEFEALEAQKRDLDAKLESSIKKINEQEAEIKRLLDEHEAARKDMEEKHSTLKASLASATDDSATVASLRSEVSTLREQLTRQVALTNSTKAARPEGGAFNMSTGTRGVENGTAAAGGMAAGAAAAGLLGQSSSSKRRQRRHSDLGAEHVAPIPEEERWEAQPRAVSVAYPQDNGVKRLGGKAYLADVYDDPAEELMKLLEEEEALDEDVLSGIIRHLKIPPANLQNPQLPKEVLFPAHLISLVTNEMWKYGMMRESERFLANVMRTIQEHVMVR